MTDVNEERLKQLIGSRLDSEGYPVKEWRTHDGEFEGVIGRAIVIEEHEDGGIYIDATGLVTASVVGAAKFGNERVAFHMYEDGYDGPNELPDLSYVEFTGD